MTGFMGFPFVEVLEIGGWCRDCTHAARRLTRFSGPGHSCSANHPKWSGWQELHLRPPRSERGRVLLTLHPENGCQTWTRTKTSGLTGRRATLTLPGNGAADRIPTCIVPFRRRMLMYSTTAAIRNWSEWQDWTSQVLQISSPRKDVRFAKSKPPATSRSQGACARPPGALKTELRSAKMADPKGVAPSTLPQTTGRSAN